MEQRQHNLVVRNTFIDAVITDEEICEPPERTRSDPTGGRSKELLPLGRIADRPLSITKEGTCAEEAGEDEPMRIPEHLSSDFCFNDEEDAEEDEEEDGVLDRSVSTGYSQGTAALGNNPAVLGRLGGASGPVTTMALNRLLPGLPEEEERGGAGTGPAATYADANMQWGFPAPYGMFNGYNPMYGYSPYAQAASSGPLAQTEAAEQGEDGSDGQEESGPSDWQPPSAAPLLGSGPPFGVQHSFHQETRDMGQVTPDFRMFTKVGYEGRLSVVSESRVHTDGVHRYLVQFTSGELSRADGVGFVFSSRLPCAKNIQRIVSIFVNQRGRICMRVFADIVRAAAYVKPLELGDWVELAMDLDKQVATFNIWARTDTGWPPVSGRPASTAEFPFGTKLSRLNQDVGQGGRKSKDAPTKPFKLNVGHLACVVKNVGVTVTLGS